MGTFHPSEQLGFLDGKINSHQLIIMAMIYLFNSCFFFASICELEIERVLSGGKDGQREESSGGKKFCDVTKDKPIKVTVRTSVPTRDHPKVCMSNTHAFINILLNLLSTPLPARFSPPQCLGFISPVGFRKGAFQWDC